MMAIDDLTSISESKRKQAIKCLDDLITFKDSEGRPSPIITGYNWYITLPKSDRVITLSHIHETEIYKEAMIKDLEKLGYDRQTIQRCIRDKSGVFLPEPDFIFIDDLGNLFPGLKLKDTRNGQYTDQTQFKSPEEFEAYLRESYGYLIVEDHGWELNIPFYNKEELINLTTLLLRKYSKYLYDDRGNLVEEVYKGNIKKASWPDAYKVPVLLLGEGALKYSNELPHFSPATKISLIKDSNEISFIIHTNLDYLKEIHNYEELSQLGFHEEICLGNKPFIKYLDKIR